MLLVVPGIIWSIRFGFFRWFIVDKNAGAVEALRLSYRATRGYSWKLFSVYILQIFIFIIAGGFVPLMKIGYPELLDFYPIPLILFVQLIGWLFTTFILLPAFAFTYTKFYRELTY